jgi:hypothetical protein
MTTKERIADLMSTKEFNDTEIEKDTMGTVNAFKSWEYHLILHYTNEEYYYLSDEWVNALNGNADLNEETEKGFIYGFK